MVTLAQDLKLALDRCAFAQALGVDPDTPYTDIADQVKSLLTGPPFTTPVISGGRLARSTTELIVDKTGVGVAVTDLLKERRLNHIAVTITGLGQKVNRHGTKEYS